MDPVPLTAKETSGKMGAVAKVPSMGTLSIMRPKVTVHLNGKRWVFTMDSPKEYSKVLDRLKNIEGVDTSSLPPKLGPDMEISVKIPDELLKPLEDESPEVEYALADATFISDMEMTTTVQAVFPAIGIYTNFPCKCFKPSPRPLATVIMHLNDVDRWSRNKIADWIETLDFKVEAAG